MLSVDWNTLTFFIPQGDLTHITGSLYELDTEVQFRQAVNSIMASEEGIVFEDPISHNTEYTVAGTTYARKIEVINGYNVEFIPDSPPWSVRLAGSNNNLFDIENGILVQNNVQVIAQNSAGLIKSAALTDAQDTKLTELHQVQGLEAGNPMTVTQSKRTTQGGEIDQDITGDGETTTTVSRN